MRKRYIDLQNTGKAEVIRLSFIFSKLSDDELAELAGLAMERSFTEGEFIFWEGDAPDWFYIVAEGQV